MTLCVAGWDVEDADVVEMARAADAVDADV